jgi:hypothetical protein
LERAGEKKGNFVGMPFTAFYLRGEIDLDAI